MSFYRKRHSMPEWKREAISKGWQCSTYKDYMLIKLSDMFSDGKATKYAKEHNCMDTLKEAAKSSFNLGDE